MSEVTAIEYEVVSKNLTSRLEHELLFSVKKRWFIKPYKHDKGLGKLFYKLLSGNYIKFSLFVSKSHDSARFRITWINISKDGKVDEKVIYDVETYWHIFVDMPDDLNCPYVLAEFIQMRPEFHKTAWIEETNYSTAEDAMQIIENIKKYLERKIASD